MKTYRLYSAILMVALSFNFVSCGDDDDNGGEPNPNIPKMRVTKIELASNNQNIHATMDYTYSDNKVSKIAISVSGNDIPWSGSGSKKPWTFEYKYQGDKVSITQTNDHFYDEGSFTDMWTLNKEGFVESSDNTACVYSSEGYLQSIKNGSNVEANLTYDQKGNLTQSIDIEGYEKITYSDIQNIGGLFVAYRDNNGVYPFSCGYGDSYFFSGLMGKATKYLPQEAYNDDGYLRFSYELDDYGYVKTVKIEDHYEDSGKTTTNHWTETYTYEEVK